MARVGMLALGRSRLVLDRDLRLVETDGRVLWLEGRVRLRPGQSVELVGEWPGIAVSVARQPAVTPDIVHAGTRAHVVTWRVVRLEREGPYYRGCCRLDV